MESENKILYLVDGTSYIHRAYHAIRHLSNSKGFPTNAIFGFTKMLLKLIEEKKPEYMAVVFDAKGPNFRHTLYKAYKATRPPMPEELVVQLSYIREIAEALKTEVLEKEGFEADDVIGTLARRAEEKSFEVIVVTGDKDFRQILSPKVSLWDTMKDKFTDYESLIKEYGVQPGQMVDVMALSGDRSDNIPGVPGIGEKTALELIRKFGSLENVFEKLNEIRKERLKQNLRASYPDAMLSKKLVSIDLFVPIEKDVEALKLGEPDRRKLAKIFHELEFKELWDRFASREKSEGRKYNLCLSMDALLSLKKMIKEKGIVSVDTETTSKNPHRAELVGISFCCESGEAYYLPLAHQYPGAPRQIERRDALRVLKEILEDEKIAKIGQNIKYDALVLRHHGIELKGICFDTMVASYVINPGLRQHNLAYLAHQFLNHRMVSYKELTKSSKGRIKFCQLDVKRAMEYSCEDADITFRLMNVLKEKLLLDENLDLFENLEMKLLPVLIDMEWQGIKVDRAFLEAMSHRFSEQLGHIEKEIYAEAGMEFNINSPQQLSFVLFEKLQLPPQKKTSKTGSYSTDVKVLTKLSALPYRIPKLLLRYRTLSKLKSTYLDALVKMVDPATGRVHTSFNQTATATGRLSSSEPNLQNIPVRGEEGKDIRKAFVASEGCYLVSADYSQIELRVFAHYSRDPAFIRAFQENEDIHARTASEILGVAAETITPEMRRIAKAINFGIIYGMGAQKLSDELGISLGEARNYISAYYKRYRGVGKYREETIAFAREKGYVLTLFNRKRYLPNIHHKNRVLRAEAERMAINTPIQGTAADLIKMAMISIHARLAEENLGAKMVLQVHDELVFDVPEDEVPLVSELIKKEMEGVYKLEVPLRVDIHVGRNWGEAH